MRLAASTYQLNVNLGQQEAVSRLRTYKTERCVTLVNDRTAVNNNNNANNQNGNNAAPNGNNAAAAGAPLTDQDLVAIFEALGELTRLQKLRVDFVGRTLRLPVVALTTVLERVPQLQQLVLEEVRLDGSVADVEALAMALRQHPSLQLVDLHCCVPAEGLETTLDPLVTALAHVPTLTEVLLRDTRIAPRLMHNNNDDEDDEDDDDSDEEGSSDEEDENTMDQEGGGGGGTGGAGSSSRRPTWSGSSLVSLCESPSLRTLTLRDMAEIRDVHLELMATSLQHNDTLRELTICSPSLGERAGRAMGQVLRSNRKLQKLEIQLNSGEDAIPITEILQFNSSLKRLDLFFNGSISPRIREAFTEMLRRNYVLLDLNGSVWRGQSNSEIDFYLRLNRAGRGDLLTEHATRAQWVDTMISQREDLSIVFSLLLMNPSICLHDTNDFRDVNSPGGVNGVSLHLRKRRKGEADIAGNLIGNL